MFYFKWTHWTTGKFKQKIGKIGKCASCHQDQIKQGVERASSTADTIIKKADEIGQVVGGKYGSKLSEASR